MPGCSRDQCSAGEWCWEREYKQKLADDFNISFNRLFTITNMPIKRFADYLYRKGELDSYMALLLNAFSPATTDSLMCTNTRKIHLLYNSFVRFFICFLLY